MNEVEKNEGKISELEQLIDLAEKVSGNLQKLKEIRNYYFMYVFLSILIFIVSLLFFVSDKFVNLEKPSFITVLVVSIHFLSLILGFYYFYKFDLILNEIKKEYGVLENLLEMTHSYKQSVYKDSSVVKKALIDMRLNRISFSRK